MKESKFIDSINDALRGENIETFVTLFKEDSKNVKYLEDGIYLYDMKIPQELHKYILIEDLASTYKTMYLRIEFEKLVLNAENVEENHSSKNFRTVVFETEDDLVNFLDTLDEILKRKITRSRIVEMGY